MSKNNLRTGAGKCSLSNQFSESNIYCSNRPLPRLPMDPILCMTSDEIVQSFERGLWAFSEDYSEGTILLLVIISKTIISKTIILERNVTLVLSTFQVPL